MRYDDLYVELEQAFERREVDGSTLCVIRTADGDVEIANVVWDAERQRLTLETGHAVE